MRANALNVWPRKAQVHPARERSVLEKRMGEAYGLALCPFRIFSARDEIPKNFGVWRRKQKIT